LELEVTDANGEVEIEKIEFIAKRPEWLGAALFIAAILLILISRIFFLKNKPAGWRMEVDDMPKESSESENSRKPSKASRQRRAKLKVGDFWNSKRKHAEVFVDRIRPLKKDKWMKTQPNGGYLKVTGVRGDSKGTVSKGNLGAEAVFQKIGGGSGDLKTFVLSLPNLQEEAEETQIDNDDHFQDGPDNGLVMGGGAHEVDDEPLMQDDVPITNDYLITLNTSTGSTARFWAVGVLLCAFLATSFYGAWLKLI
jgi:hypothetical protein